MLLRDKSLFPDGCPDDTTYRGQPCHNQTPQVWQQGSRDVKREAKITQNKFWLKKSKIPLGSPKTKPKTWFLGPLGWSIYKGLPPSYQLGKVWDFFRRKRFGWQGRYKSLTAPPGKPPGQRFPQKMIKVWVDVFFSLNLKGMICSGSFQPLSFPGVLISINQRGPSVKLWNNLLR